MVRKQEYRQKKYEVKVDADIVRQRFQGEKSLMVEQEALHFPALTILEQQVKGILEPQGVKTIEIPYYLSFARKIYSLVLRFPIKTSETTLIKECRIAVDEWSSRGLNKAMLEEILKLFGIVFPLILTAGKWGETKWDESIWS